MVITGLTRNQVASRGLEGSNPSVSASATGNAFKRCLIFIPLRRRKRRARAPARARAARDWADGLIFSYILLLPPIAERRIPPSRGVTGTVILSVVFLSRCAGGDGEPEPLRGLELHAIGQPRCYILIRFVCQQSLKGESLRLRQRNGQCFQALPFLCQRKPRDSRGSSKEAQPMR